MIVVLSDLHLGLARAPRPAEMAPLFEGATRVILNGDATELATPTFATQAADSLEALREMVVRSGATLEVLAGNHDPGITPQLHAWLADGRALVTHGHAFHPLLVPWSPHAAEAGRVHAEALRELASLPELERRLQAADRAARRERELDLARPPWREVVSLCAHPLRSVHIVGFWRIFPELAVRFRDACAPEATMVVCGHSHRAGAWWVRGCLVLNTGSFTFPGTPHAVLHEGDEVVLVPLARTRGSWRYMAEARRLWRTHEIASAAAAARTPVS